MSRNSSSVEEGLDCLVHLNTKSKIAQSSGNPREGVTTYRCTNRPHLTSTGASTDTNINNGLLYTTSNTLSSHISVVTKNSRQRFVTKSKSASAFGKTCSGAIVEADGSGFPVSDSDAISGVSSWFCVIWSVETPASIRCEDGRATLRAVKLCAITR